MQKIWRYFNSERILKILALHESDLNLTSSTSYGPCGPGMILDHRVRSTSPEHNNVCSPNKKKAIFFLNSLYCHPVLKCLSLTSNIKHNTEIFPLLTLNTIQTRVSLGEINFLV